MPAPTNSNSGSSTDFTLLGPDDDDQEDDDPMGEIVSLRKNARPELYHDPACIDDDHSDSYTKVALRTALGDDRRPCPTCYPDGHDHAGDAESGE